MSSKKILRFLIIPAALFGIGLTPCASLGGFQVFDTIAGGVDLAGEAVKAEASFTTGNGTITINLKNLIVNQKSIGQNVSDLLFTVGGAPSVASMTSSLSTARDVAADGTYTDLTPAVATGWALSISNGTIHLNGLAGATYTPEHTLIGLPDQNNLYSNANSSIRGNGPHNPFLTNPTTFTLSVAGVTASTVISGVSFSFGTTAGDNVAGTPVQVVPAPNSAILALAGVPMIGLFGWLRRRKSAAPGIAMA